MSETVTKSDERSACRLVTRIDRRHNEVYVSDGEFLDVGLSPANARRLAHALRSAAEALETEPGEVAY